MDFHFKLTLVRVEFYHKYNLQEFEFAGVCKIYPTMKFTKVTSEIRAFSVPAFTYIIG